MTLFPVVDQSVEQQWLELAAADAATVARLVGLQLYLAHACS